MSTPPKDLFKRYATPPTRLHDAVQGRAREAGWTAPWDREEQQKTAGKKSGRLRAERAEIRRIFVKAAFKGLKPSYQMQPFSNDSIKALQEEYLNLLKLLVKDHDGSDLLMAATLFVEKTFAGQPAYQKQLLAEYRSLVGPLITGAAPFKVDRDTLIKDLKALGIRSKRRLQRSG